MIDSAPTPTPGIRGNTAALRAGHPDRRARAEALAQARPTAANWVNAAFEHISDDRYAEGHAALDEALRIEPASLHARWLSMQYPLNPAPASYDDIEQFRRHWRDGLAYFEGLDFRQGRIRAQILGCAASCTPFFLHYLGECSDDMRRYGRLLHKMMSAIDAGRPRRRIVRERRRIAFCSTLFHEHTIARLFVPLLERLDRQQFELHALYPGGGNNPWARRVAACAQLHDGPANPLDWRERLGRIDADVIVYLDLGMHPLTQALSAVRLAPVQAALWGHPVTTGLPSMDYFLSPDRFESDNGADHYSETLVRLLGSGHGLEPLDVLSEPLADIRRESGTLELLCPQSVFKLMPEQDVVFARVLATMPQARLHMVPHHREHVRDWLRERMRPVFAAHGVDVDSRVVMHGLMPLSRFRSLARACDFSLDSLGWSGGMTALDLLPLGIPIVTLEGGCMRERQTAALLKQLDIAELVASDADDYVRIAQRLGNDAAWRGELIARLRDNAPRLSQHDTTAMALSHFLATVQPASLV